MAVETDQRTGRRGIRNLRLGGFIQKGFWGLCDQGLISASGFVTTVVLARTLGPTDFGAFTLVYAVIFFANALQSALVTRPHNVVGTTHDGAEYRRYTTATAVSQLGLVAALVSVTFLCAVVARGAGWGIAPLLLPLVPAVAAWQMQEFFRRVLYTEGRLKDAFANDAVSYGAQAVGIIALGHFGRLTGGRALVIIALTSTIAAAWGLQKTKRSLERRGVWVMLRERWLAENWRFGKWIFGAILVSSASSQLYPVLLGGLISIAEAGFFRAIITIFGRARILLTAMETVVTPTAARVFGEKGTPALHSFIGRIVLITAPIMATYCVLVSVFATPILVTLYGDRYRQYGWALALLAVGYALSYVKVPVLIALEGRQASAPVFQASLWSGVVGLAVGVVAVHRFGLLGAALGTIVESLVSNVVLWWRYRRIAATNVSEAPQWA